MSPAVAGALPLLWAGLIVAAARSVTRGARTSTRLVDGVHPAGDSERTLRSAPRLVPLLSRPRVRRIAVIVGGCALLVGQVPLALVAGVVAAVPSISGRRSLRRNREQIDRRLPELADVLRLGAASGLPLRDTVGLAAGVLSGPVALVLRRGVEELGRGQPLAPVMRGIGRELGPDGRGLIAVVLAAETDGAGSETALTEVALDLRRARAARAEARARRLPVLMLFPLVLCVLPAFALLSVVPVVVAGVSEALRSA